MPAGRRIDVAALGEAEQVLGVDAVRVAVAMLMIVRAGAVRVRAGSVLVIVPAFTVIVRAVLVVTAATGAVLVPMRGPRIGPRRVAPRPHLDGLLPERGFLGLRRNEPSSTTPDANSNRIVPPLRMLCYTITAKKRPYVKGFLT